MIVDYQSVQPAERSDGPSRREFVLSEQRTRVAISALAVLPWNASDAVQIGGASLLSASETLVPHGLGRKFVSYSVLRVRGNALVYEDPATTADLGLFVPLKCTANCIIDLAVW